MWVVSHDCSCAVVRVISHQTDAGAGFSPGTSFSFWPHQCCPLICCHGCCSRPIWNHSAMWLILPLQQKIFLRLVAQDYGKVEKSCIFIGCCDSGNDRTTAITHEALHKSRSFCRTQGTMSFFVMWYYTKTLILHISSRSVPDTVPVWAFVLAVIHVHVFDWSCTLHVTMMATALFCGTAHRSSQKIM